MTENITGKPNHIAKCLFCEIFIKILILIYILVLNSKIFLKTRGSNSYIHIR